MNGSYYDTADWTGAIGEQIIYSWALSSLERQKVDTYLATKYGTTMGAGELQLSANTTNIAALSVGQTFTTSATGKLTSITLRTGGTANAATGVLSVCSGGVSLTNCINNVGSVRLMQQNLTTIPTTINTVFTTTLTTPLALTPGTQYTFVISSGTNVYYSIQNSDVYLGGAQVGFGTQDMYFNLDIKPDYVSSTGALLWNEAGYHNFVTAIGRDDASGLITVYCSKYCR